MSVSINDKLVFKVCFIGKLNFIDMTPTRKFRNSVNIEDFSSCNKNIIMINKLKNIVNMIRYVLL